MGITGELVKSVFSKSRSIRTQETSVRSNSERRKWKTSVRSYLCGHDFNSVLAEEDPASLRSSKVTVSTQPEFSSFHAAEDPASSVWSAEATITQPVPLGLIDAVDAQNRQTNGDIQEKHNSTSRLFNKDDAATIIQSAFRSFLARRQMEGLNLTDGNDNPSVGAESRRSGSTGTSIEFQTGNTTGVHSFRDKMGRMPPPLQVKGRPQGLKLKEDWNGSTVSSNISKLRMQNRLEATTRRERALAIAFSQQLRVCSKKKPSRSKSDIVESNMGWSWLERWMATRQQENCLLDITKQYERPNSNQISAARKKRLFFDVTGEDESCGSNEVSVQLTNKSASAFQQEKAENIEPLEDTLRPTSVSRCKTLPSYHYPEKNVKVIKKDCAGEDKVVKKHYQAIQRAGSKLEAKCKDAASQPSQEFSHC